MFFFLLHRYFLNPLRGNCHWQKWIGQGKWLFSCFVLELAIRPPSMELGKTWKLFDLMVKRHVISQIIFSFWRSLKWLLRYLGHFVWIHTGTLVTWIVSSSLTGEDENGLLWIALNSIPRSVIHIQLTILWGGVDSNSKSSTEVNSKSETFAPPAGNWMLWD